MKIVNKQEFYKLPSGTLYSDYEESVITGLKIKGDTIFSDGKPIDFFYTELVDGEDNWETTPNENEIVLNFDIRQRDGMFDDSDLYGVYNGHEIAALSKKINNCIGLK